MRGEWNRHPKGDSGMNEMLTRGTPEAHNKFWRSQITKAQNEGSNAAGGVFVPGPVADSIIRLVQQYAVARQNSGVFVMGSDTLNLPRRTSAITASWTAEAGSLSESSVTFDKVDLTAKKLTALLKVSSELFEDSVPFVS